MEDREKLLPGIDKYRNYGSEASLVHPDGTGSINAINSAGLTASTSNATSSDVRQEGTLPCDDVPLRTKLYKRRWYILVVYSLFSATQNCVWNTWSPISASAEDAFGWDDGMLSILANWGTISYILGAFLFSWFISTRGIRLPVVASMALITTGCGIRCISSTPPLVTWVSNIGGALNGLAGPIAMFVPPVLSSTWFGPHERTTSTALSIVIANLGTGVSFLIGPFLVKDRLDPNCTKAPVSNESFLNPDCAEYFNKSAERISLERKDILFLLYIEAAWSAFLLLLILLYFPNKPKLPPCVSASKKRETFTFGLKTLIRRPQFWLVTFVYGVSLGVADCWTGFVDVIIKPYGIREKEAGWMGFYANLSMSAVSLVAARFADRFSRHFKLLIFGLYVLGVISVGCFALICVGVLPSRSAFLYTTFILTSVALYGAEPMVYELACEMTFPIAEGTTNAVMTLVSNVFGFVFLFVPSIPHIGTAWMNWTMMGSIVVCLPVILLWREKYNRLEMDEDGESKTK